LGIPVDAGHILARQFVLYAQGSYEDVGVPVPFHLERIDGRTHASQMLAQFNFMGSLARDPAQRKRDRRKNHDDGQGDEQLKKRHSRFFHRTLTMPFPSGGAPAATSPLGLMSATRIGDTP